MERYLIFILQKYFIKYQFILSGLEEVHSFKINIEASFETIIS